MREEGLEPPREKSHQILNLARLPIPPLSRIMCRGNAAPLFHPHPALSRRERMGRKGFEPLTI